MFVMRITTSELISGARSLAAPLITFMHMLVYSLLPDVIELPAFGSTTGLADIEACCCLLTYAPAS